MNGPTVPVNLKLPVALPILANTPFRQHELQKPFVGLREVVSPYYSLLSALPDRWDETPNCEGLSQLLCLRLAKNSKQARWK